MDESVLTVKPNFSGEARSSSIQVQPLFVVNAYDSLVLWTRVVDVTLVDSVILPVRLN